MEPSGERAAARSEIDARSGGERSGGERSGEVAERSASEEIGSVSAEVAERSASEEIGSVSADIPTDFLREMARAPAAAPPIDLAGKTLGRYRIERRLGRGGMGVVYAARDLVLERPIALKVLPPHLAGDEERGRRLLVEARSAARAAHPGIAAVYDVETIDGHLLISMELVPGKTLRALLAERANGSRRGLPIADAARIGEQMARALAHAHRMGVVHRDLKPENVMVTGDGSVKILDFGLAKIRATEEHPETISGAPTGEGRVLGTPGYMAPEQARGRPVDARADLFSLGVVLYELVTGSRPFAGATPEERLLSLHLDEPAPPSQRTPDLPPALERIILRCLQKKPDDRPASAAEIEEALREALGAPREKPGRVRRRWLWLAPLAPIAALLAMVLLRGKSRPPEANSTPPLAAPGAVLACPMLEARGVEEPSGWLGAAAANVACMRAQALLGGDPARVRLPASLLDVPRLPADEFPDDPFSAPDARARSLAAARGAAAFLDGSVARERGAFSVHLALHAPDGRVLAEGSGQGAELYASVRDAMSPLVAPGAIPPGAAVSPGVAAVRGATSTPVLLALTDFELALWSGADARAEASRLAAHRDALGPRWVEIELDLAQGRGTGFEGLRAPEIDRSSPAAFAWSAPARAMLDPQCNAGALADEAAALAAAEKDETVRAALHAAEAQLRCRTGNTSAAATLLLDAIEKDPASRGYPLLTMVSWGVSKSMGPSAFAAWRPEIADAWNAVGLMRGARHGGTGFLRRAHVLGTYQPLFSIHLGTQLLARGQREEARAVAADLLSGTSAAGGDGAAEDRRVAAELLLANIEASEGRVGAAAQRARTALFGLPVFGRVHTGEGYLLTLLVDVAALLEQRPSPDADAFVAAFVDPEPVRLYPSDDVLGRVAAACAIATPKVAARCFSKLRTLIGAGYFRAALSPDLLAFVEGAEAFSRSDWAAAAAAWRPVSRRPGSKGHDLVPVAYDRAGEPDLADTIDSWALGGAGVFDGLSPAHARLAERAFARGDLERARPLAERILEKWSLADVPVPAVARIRALMDGRPARREAR